MSESKPTFKIRPHLSCEDLADWTDAELDELEAISRESIKREWCGTLTLQSLREIEAERARRKSEVTR